MEKMLSFSEFLTRYRNDMPTLYDSQLAKIYAAYVKLDNDQKKYRAIIEEGHASIDVITTKIGRKSIKIISFKPGFEAVDNSTNEKEVTPTTNETPEPKAIDLSKCKLEYRTDLNRFEVKDPSL